MIQKQFTGGCLEGGVELGVDESGRLLPWCPYKSDKP